MVFTPERSITFGGFFFCFDVLHLMEWTRRWIHEGGGAGTNTYHPSVQRQLANVVIAWAMGGEEGVSGFSFGYCVV